MKYKIAVIDDEQVQREYLINILKKWQKDQKLEIELNQYHNAESFLFAYEDDKSYDILLVDIEMDNINGIELAKKIRETNDYVQIIFITGFAEYISLGFDVSALHYLMKPVNSIKLCEVLNKAIALLAKKEPILIIKVDKENIILKLNEICYIESLGHYIEINLINGMKYTIKQGINKIIEELNANFIMTHRSYIVNIKYIKSINKLDVILDNNKMIPISKNCYTVVNQAFINYYKE